MSCHEHSGIERGRVTTDQRTCVTKTGPLPGTVKVDKPNQMTTTTKRTKWPTNSCSATDDDNSFKPAKTCEAKQQKKVKDSWQILCIECVLTHSTAVDLVSLQWLILQQAATTNDSRPGAMSWRNRRPCVTITHSFATLPHFFNVPAYSCSCSLTCSVLFRVEIP